MKLIYSPKYEVDIGTHPFKTSKYRKIRERLLAHGKFIHNDFIEPFTPSDEDVMLCHTREWTEKVRNGRLSSFEIAQLELPYSPALSEVAFLWCGGSMLTAKQALEDGISVHLGGGWHHAFPDHGEGFCVLNDHSVAIRRLLADKAIERAAIVDCDCHQGNGTATIFAGDPAVFTFSIHQENNYPSIKPPSTLDVGLDDETGDMEYIDKLALALPKVMDFKPDLIVYVAGADTYKWDQLGGLALTIDGHVRRDELVLDTALKQDVPVAIVLAGGYAMNPDDTVEIHSNTAIAALDRLSLKQQRNGNRN